MNDSGVSNLAKAAIGVAIASFFISIETSNVSTANGVVTACEYLDYGALVLGAAACVLGLLSGMGGLVRRSAGTATVGAVALVLGAYHVASGLGLIGGPCA